MILSNLNLLIFIYILSEYGFIDSKIIISLKHHMTIADLEGSKAFWKMKTIQIVKFIFVYKS